MPDNNLDDAWADALADKTSSNQPDEGANDDWASALGGQGSEGDVATGPMQFDELGEGPTQQVGTQNLEFLLDVPLEVQVELGRSSLIINKLLQLTQGSVIELDKAAGEPVEIYVNDKLLGKGEVIVVNERFGVRITEIISQADRIKSMG